MADLINILQQQLNPSTIDQLSRRIGADEEKTGQAIGALLPILIGGLSRNARRSNDELQSLNRALERDHDGSLLDHLPALLGNASGGSGASMMSSLGALLGDSDTSRRSTNAEGILGHILGSQRNDVERGVSKAAGLNAGQVAQLASILAPMLMGALGKAKRQQSLDPQGVRQLLERERQTIEQEASDTQEGGLLDLLDSNRDGQVNLADDVAKVGMALGTAFLLSQRRKS